MSVVVRVKVVTDDKQFKTMVREMKKAFGTIGKDAKGITEQISKPPKEARKHWDAGAKSIRGFIGQLKLIAGMGGVVAIMRKAGAAMEDFAITSDRARISLVALRQVGKGVGADQTDIKNALAATMDDGLIPMNVALQNLQDLMRSGLGAEESVILMTRLKDLAAINRSVHIDFQSAVLNLTQAFKTEQSRLGDLSGLTENFATNIIPVGIRAMNAMGIAVTKESIALDDNMRALVKYHGIMELTEELAGGSKVMTEGVTGAIAAQEKAWTDLKIEMGKDLQPTLMMWHNFWAALADSATDSLESQKDIARTMALDIVTAGTEAAQGWQMAMLSMAGGAGVAPGMPGGGLDPSTVRRIQREFAKMEAEASASAERIVKILLSSLTRGLAPFQAIMEGEPGTGVLSGAVQDQILSEMSGLDAVARARKEEEEARLAAIKRINDSLMTSIGPSSQLLALIEAGSDAWKRVVENTEEFQGALNVAQSASNELFSLMRETGIWDEMISALTDGERAAIEHARAAHEVELATKAAAKAAAEKLKADRESERALAKQKRLQEKAARESASLAKSLDKTSSLYRQILEASRAEPETLEEWRTRLDEVNSSAKGLRDKFYETSAAMREMAKGGDSVKLKALNEERNRLMREYLDLLKERKRIEGEIADRAVETLDLQVLKQQAVEDGIERSTTAALEFAFHMREGQKIGDAIIDIWKRILVEMSAAIVKQAILNALQAMGFFSSFNLPFGGGGSGPPLDASAGVHAARGGVVPPRRPRYYAGGGFESRGTDTVPAMLTPGEGILTREATRNLGGAAAINALNRSQGAAMGGVNINIGGGTFVGPGGAREFAANLHAEMLDLIRTNDYEGLVA